MMTVPDDEKDAEMSVETAHSPNGIRLLVAFMRSSVGAKVVMALTGLLMWGFVIGHLVGNLQVFLPAAPDGYLGKQLNDYAHFLKSTPSLLWGTRIALLVSVFLHIGTGIRLARENRAARGRDYASWRPRKATFASRYMTFSGLFILAFIVFHILHFTAGVVDPSLMILRDQADQHDVYRMMWVGFQNPGAAGFYIVGMGLLLLHLVHGSVSLFQSLGIRSRAWTPVITIGARAIVFLLFVGFASIPTVLFVSWSLHGTH